MEEKNNFVKPRKVGRITFGFILILIGIAIFIQTVTVIDMIRYVLMLSPFIFISLGLEVIILSRKNDIKYDIAGIILTFITLGAGWIFTGINYGVNKILYDDNVKGVLISSLIEDEHAYCFENKLQLSNLSNKEIELEIIETDKVDETIMYVNYSYDIENNNNYIIEKIVNNDYNMIEKIIDYNGSFTFLDLDEKIQKIQIKVFTKKKENVRYEGNFVDFK